MVEKKLLKSSAAVCGGKVLLCGGYLILERENEGVVVSTDARGCVASKLYEREESDKTEWMRIRVTCPQLTAHAMLEYVYNFETGQFKPLSQYAVNNKFVTEAVRASVTFMMNSKELCREFVKGTKYEVYARVVVDAPFYGSRAIARFERNFEGKSYAETRQAVVSAATEEKIPSWAMLQRSFADSVGRDGDDEGDDVENGKTGLGSSAVVVSSIVSSLCHLFWKEEPNQKQFNWLCHGLAQAAHCKAQGKVGSGFDVAASVFGSHCYTRYTPALLNDYLADDSNVAHLRKFTKEIDCKHRQFVLPPGVHVVLGDVKGDHSKTPSMVGKLLQWLNGNEDSDKIWSEYREINSKIVESLCDRGQEEQLGAYHKALFLGLYQVLKRISACSKVPIVPDSLQEVIEDTFRVEGVIGVGVPGAGGYDAVFAIIQHETFEGACALVRDLWMGHSIKLLPVRCTTQASGLSVNSF